MTESTRQGTGAAPLPEGFAEAAPARTPGRDIFGPLDDHLPEVRIPADVKVQANRAAALAGHDLTGWLRELVYASLYGPEHLGSLHEARARRVLGNAGQSTEQRFQSLADREQRQ